VACFDLLPLARGDVPRARSSLPDRSCFLGAAESLTAVRWAVSAREDQGAVATCEVLWTAVLGEGSAGELGASCRRVTSGVCAVRASCVLPGRQPSVFDGVSSAPPCLVRGAAW
jgi:hypothetical protein